MSSAQAAVFEALAGATSQDPAIFGPSSALLAEWESQPGFFTALMVKGLYDVFSAPPSHAALRL